VTGTIEPGDTTTVEPTTVRGDMVLAGLDSWCDGTFASNKGPWGKGHTTASCSAGCAQVPDCNYASVSKKGHCRFWSACTLEDATGSSVYVF
jgi:hypothetical protein